MTPRIRKSVHLAVSALAVLAAACSQDAGSGDGGAQTPVAEDDAVCGRSCLVGLLDQHLAAVIAHDISATPLTEDFRATQNAIETAPGEGVWMTATALGALQRRYADPETGQAGYIGLLGEREKTAIVSLRIRVEDRRISEAEWVIAREDETAINPAGLIANPPPDASSVKGEVSRAAAIRAVETYFAGIEASDGSGVLAYPDCYRIENGFWMVGKIPERATVDPADAQPGFNSSLNPNPDTTCLSGFENLKNVTEAVRELRYFFDEDANAVWATGIFQRVEGAVDRRGDPIPWLYFSSLYRIEDGRVRGTHAAMHYLPSEITGSGWGDK